MELKFRLLFEKVKTLRLGFKFESKGAAPLGEILFRETFKILGDFKYFIPALRAAAYLSPI
jgi:hypothetical protein